MECWNSRKVTAVTDRRYNKGKIGNPPKRIAGKPNLNQNQSCAIALSSAEKSWPIVASVSSPMLEMRNVLPLIFP